MRKRYSLFAGPALGLLPSLCLGSGYEFEGVGARQVSRAGAATADADDWSAIYWNPANLAREGVRTRKQLGAEAFGGIAFGHDSNSLSNLPGVGAIFSKNDLSSSFILGALGATLPLSDRVGLGFGVYTPLLQGVDFHDTAANGEHLDLKASAGIVTGNISMGIQLNPQWALGFGLDLLYGRVSSRTTLLNAFGVPGETVSSDQTADGVGLEALAGLRFDPHPELSLAAVYRSGADVGLRGRATAGSSGLLPLPPSESADVGFSLNHPPTSDLGLAFRPAQGWTLTTDLHQTYWRRFSNAFAYSPSGQLLASNSNSFHWRDTWKLRFGVLHQLAKRWDAMAGYSYDRFAIDSSSIDLSTAIDVPMHRFSGGTTYHISDRLETTLGAIGGLGRRTEGVLDYRLSGWQLMSELAFTFD